MDEKERAVIRQKSISLRNVSRKSKLDDSQKKSARIFLIYFSTLIYILITTLSITDVQLILNDPVTLPVISVRVNITMFFIISPIILILLFTFFNVHLLHLKRVKTTIDNYLLWPIFEFEKFDSPKVEENRFNNFLQLSISNVTLWGLFPITLLIIGIRFCYTHTIPLMFYQMTTVILGCIIAFLFWKRNYSDKHMKMTFFTGFITLLMIKIFYYIYHIPLVNNYFKENIFPNPNKDIYLLVIITGIILFTSVVVNYILKNRTNAKYPRYLFATIWIYILFSSFIIFNYIIKTPLGEGRNVNLSYQIISQNPNVLYKSIYSVNLRSKHLEGANLVASVLAKADLRDAQLQYSSLNRAKLNGADLSGVNLSFTDLRRSDFSNTILRNANFLGAQLDSANLRNADLRGAKGLYIDSLCEAYSLYGAELDPSLLVQVNEKCPELLDSLKE